MIDATLRWPYPTLFLEHKLLYGEKLDPLDYEALPAEEDVVADLFPTLRKGSTDPDVTLVSYGGMLPIVESAADYLAQDEELEVEIVCPSLRKVSTNSARIRNAVSIFERSVIWLPICMPTSVLVDGQGCEIATIAGPAEWGGEDAVKLIKAALAPTG